MRALLLGSFLTLNACNYYTCDGQICGGPCTFCRQQLYCDLFGDKCHTETECWELGASDPHRCNRSQDCVEVDFSIPETLPFCQ